MSENNYFNGALKLFAYKVAPIHLVLFCLFGLWLVATAAAQFEGHYKSIQIKRFDILNLLPSWTFFAPVPCLTDFSLIYRDFDCDGTPTRWCDANLIVDRTFISFFWNPRKRKAKCLFDVVQMLVPFQKNEDLPILSFSYLWSLHTCMAYPKEAKSVYRQFAIVAILRSGDSEKISSVLLSLQHPLG